MDPAPPNQPERPPPYDIEPPEEPAPQPPPPRIDAPGVLEGFEPDADFDRDPDLERIASGGAGSAARSTPHKPSAAAAEPDAERPDLVSDNDAEAKVWAAVGALLLVAALVATAITATPRLVSMALVLYNTAVHTGTGVVAAYITAAIFEHRVRRPEFVAARIFPAIAALELVYHLNIQLAGDTKTEEIILAALAYVAVVVASFRIWRERLAVLIGSHFVLWLIVRIGMELSAFAARP